MPSDKKCCIPGCCPTEGSRPVLHKFPNPMKDPERFQAWISSIGGQVRDLAKEFVYDYRRVCNAHFEQKFICRNNRLLAIAIPTLNLPNMVDAMNVTTVQQTTTSTIYLSCITNMSSMPSISKDLTCITNNVSRKRRPLSAIENIDSMPSTSKELYGGAVKENEPKQATTFINCPKKSMSLMPITSAEKALKKKLVAAKIRLSKFKKRVKEQAATIKAAQNLITNPITLKALENLPKGAKIITLLQLRESKKKMKGRRFNYDEKILGLSLLKQSPKGYRLLRKIFILPAPQTLIKLLMKANIQPGGNKNIFDQLSAQAAKMKPLEKLCTLLFDEMALKSNYLQ